MIRKLIMFAITSGLAAKAWNHFRDRQDRRRGRVPAKAIQTWEGEGGMPANPNP